MVPSFPKSIIAKQRCRTFTVTMMVDARIRPKKKSDRPLLNGLEEKYVYRRSLLFPFVSLSLLYSLSHISSLCACDLELLASNLLKILRPYFILRIPQKRHSSNKNSGQEIWTDETIKARSEAQRRTVNTRRATHDKASSHLLLLHTSHITPWASSYWT